jgi:hypothetical protein
VDVCHLSVNALRLNILLHEKQVGEGITGSNDKSPLWICRIPELAPDAVTFWMISMTGGGVILPSILRTQAEVQTDLSPRSIIGAERKGGTMDTTAIEKKGVGLRRDTRGTR